MPGILMLGGGPAAHSSDGWIPFFGASQEVGGTVGLKEGSQQLGSDCDFFKDTKTRFRGKSSLQHSPDELPRPVKEPSQSCWDGLKDSGLHVSSSFS